MCEEMLFVSAKTLWWTVRGALIAVLVYQLLAPLIFPVTPATRHATCDVGMSVVLWVELLLSLLLSAAAALNAAIGMSDDAMGSTQRSLILSIIGLHVAEALFCIGAFVTALSSTILCEGAGHWSERGYAQLSCAVLYAGFFASVVVWPRTMDTRITGLAVSGRVTIAVDANRTLQSAARLLKDMYTADFSFRIASLHLVLLAWWLVDGMQQHRSACLGTWTGCPGDNGKCHLAGARLELFLLSDVAFSALLYAGCVWYSARALLKPVFSMSAALKIFALLQATQICFGLYGVWWLYMETETSCAEDSPRLFYMALASGLCFLAWRGFWLFFGCAWLPKVSQLVTPSLQTCCRCRCRCRSPLSTSSLSFGIFTLKQRTACGLSYSGSRRPRRSASSSSRSIRTRTAPRRRRRRFRLRTRRGTLRPAGRKGTGRRRCLGCCRIVLIRSDD